MRAPAGRGPRARRSRPRGWGAAAHPPAAAPAAPPPPPRCADEMTDARQHHPRGAQRRALSCRARDGRNRQCAQRAPQSCVAEGLHEDGRDDGDGGSPAAGAHRRGRRHLRTPQAHPRRTRMAPPCQPAEAARACLPACLPSVQRSAGQTTQPARPPHNRRPPSPSSRPRAVTAQDRRAPAYLRVHLGRKHRGAGGLAGGRRQLQRVAGLPRRFGQGPPSLSFS
jgi:hypothetical protein